jgi:hypothetical protein
MSNTKLVAVDSGRYRVKSMLYTPEFNKYQGFESKFAFVDFKILESIPMMNFQRDEDFIVSIDGSDPIAYGNICEKLFTPENIQYVSDDSVYLDYSINYTFLSIANLVTDGDTVQLAINLTNNNMALKEIVRNKLSGKHKVTYFDNVGNIIREVTFTVDKVGVFFQGWVSYLNVVYDRNNQIIPGKGEDEVIVFDLGRKTLDISLITTIENGLTSKISRSYNRGTESFFSYIRDKLIKYIDPKTGDIVPIDKKTIEIEKLFIDNKTVISHRGKKYDISEVIQSSLNIYKTEIMNEIKNDFQKYSVEEYYITGGGAIRFSELFRDIFDNIQVIDNPGYSNVIGLTKLLARKFIKKINDI